MALPSFTTKRRYFGQSTPEPDANTGPPERSPRRLVTGVALTAQKCRLLLGDVSYQCRVLDVANGGYCVTLLGEVLPEFCFGTIAVLEQTDKSQTPVELRWMNGAKIGLKRLPRQRPG